MATPQLPTDIGRMVRAARDREWVRLADGDIAQLHEWPIPAEHRKPGTRHKRKSRPRVCLPNGYFRTVNVDDVVELLGHLPGATR